MAVKYYCDPCGKEINDSVNRDSWVFEFAQSNGKPPVKVEVEAMVSINGATNSGHICVDCVKKTLLEGLYRKKKIR